MRSQRLAIVLSAVNLVLLVGMLGRPWMGRAEAQSAAGADDVAPIVRTRGLEVVDEQGRVRALLAVMPETTVDGKAYPETVLLRLIDPASGPVVKLTAAVDGAGLSLSDPGDGGVLILARDVGSSVQVTDPTGAKETLRP